MHAPSRPALVLQVSRMDDQSGEDDDLPSEIDFSKGVRGLHYIPPDAKVFLPDRETAKRNRSDGSADRTPLSRDTQINE